MLGTSSSESQVCFASIAYLSSASQVHQTESIIILQLIEYGLKNQTRPEQENMGSISCMYNSVSLCVNETLQQVLRPQTIATDKIINR